MPPIVHHPEPADRAVRVAVVGLGVAYVAAVALVAWTSDDARITFRVVENLVQGHGLRWNTDDRVQVFTHPAWLMVLTALRGVVSVQVWRLALLTSLGLVAVSVAALVRRHRATSLLPVLAAFVGSKTLVEYGTSGLENPLTLALLVGLAGSTASGSGRAVLAWGGLLLLNRLDLVLVVLPVVLHTGRSRGWTWQVLGVLVLPALWGLFALVWFGSPWPSAWLAKVAIDVGWAERLGRAGTYLLRSSTWDPAIAMLMVGGAALALVKGDGIARSWAVGAAGGLLLVVLAGGDFMAGRFLFAPAVASAMAALRTMDSAASVRRRRWVWGSLLLLPLAVLPPRAALRPEFAHADHVLDRTGIADERSFHAEASGLLAAWAGDPAMDVYTGPPSDGPVVFADNAGAAGSSAGPGVHVVEPYGLTDPFIALLPVDCRDQRVGHCRRELPPGLAATMAAGRPVDLDRSEAACWERVALATRAPLTASGRWQAIAALAWLGCEDLWDAEAR